MAYADPAAHRAERRAYMTQYRITHHAQTLAAMKRWREAHPERVKMHSRRTADVRRDTINALKRRPCSDCGRTFPPVCMDFDHVPERGPKRNDIAALTVKLALAEIAKCDVVCANCHRIRTQQRREAAA